MPKEYGRNRRVADVIQRELASLIQKYVQDSGSGLITISTIDVSPDLRNARIYVTCMGNQLAKETIVDDLNELAGQFRHELAQTSTMRSVPKLDFRFDTALERANHLTSLIDSLHNEKKDGS
jgi:ribosome-binding factor A